MLSILFLHVKRQKRTERQRGGDVSDYLLIKRVNEVCEGC